MVHQRLMRYNTFKYYKFFCWYFAQFNDIKFSRYFKFGFLILLWIVYQVEDVILFIFKLLKLIVFIFRFFQSPKLIKYVF
jgi:hypothetical protein